MTRRASGASRDRVLSRTAVEQKYDALVSRVSDHRALDSYDRPTPSSAGPGAAPPLSWVMVSAPRGHIIQLSVMTAF
eukprot:scaffold46602_cov84-Phaeocystis_antarctica.AAC.1